MISFFKYEELKKFFNYIKNIAKVTSLGNWDGEKGILLRHDVDLDIKAAYRLSLIEKECGIESTFFIMITCPTYNPLSLENRKMLSEMVNNDFEIGLHFNPDIYGNISLNELKEKVDVEAKILKSIVNQDIISISLHNPSIDGRYPIFEDYKNAYNKEIFSDDAYLSDSCMNFRAKNPFEFVKKAKKMPIQVLLHPAHYTENGDNYLDIFADFALNFINDVDKNFRVISTYLSLIKNENLIDFIKRRMKK